MREMKRIMVKELGCALVHGRYKVTFKYWHVDDCACGAVRKVKYFDRKPTEEELVNSI